MGHRRSEQYLEPDRGNLEPPPMVGAAMPSLWRVPQIPGSDVNSRELSEHLDELATRLEASPDSSQNVLDVAQELRRLSNEKYAPGNSTTWAEIQPKAGKKIHTDSRGNKLPF